MDVFQPFPVICTSALYPYPNMSVSNLTSEQKKLGWVGSIYLVKKSNPALCPFAFATYKHSLIIQHTLTLFQKGQSDFQIVCVVPSLYLIFPSFFSENSPVIFLLSYSLFLKFLKLTSIAPYFFRKTE